MVQFEYSQPYTKSAFRFCALRHYCYSLNDSGLYHIHNLQVVAQICKVNYNTLRKDLKEFQRRGWLHINGKYFSFRRLRNPLKGWSNLFKGFYKEIFDSERPEMKFCAYVLRRNLFSTIYKQAIVISKINSEDHKNRVKFLKIVRASNTALGASRGFRFSLRSIGRHLDKSAATVCRYLTNMKQVGVRYKPNCEHVCEYKDYQSVKKALELYGRTFTKKVVGEWKVYKRTQSTLFFL